MHVAVYGTLKRGYGNSRILTEGTGKFVKNIVVEGFKLYNAGFPVAARSPRDCIHAELWDIGDVDNDPKAMATLQRLDRLEGEGSMYHRVQIMQPNDDATHTTFYMYVGGNGFWRFDTMDSEPVDDDGIYYWERNYR